MLQHLAATFVGLRGNLSDELREVGFCRVRLSELGRLFDEVPPGEEVTITTSGPRKKEGSIGRKLFLAGCKNLSEAVALYMDEITADHIYELDGRIEVLLRKQFTALVHVCLTNANVLKDLQGAMLGVAREYAAEHLPPISVADLFFGQFSDPQEAEAEIGHCHQESAPEITPGRGAKGGSAMVEMCVLATPDDPACEKFRRLVKATLPETDLQEASSPDDVVFYRERINLALTDLEQMGPVGRDAYSQMTSTENFTPHSRIDIDFRKG